MCRWASYIGKPILLEQIVASPSRSLITQSRRSLQAETEINADGFGVAWYGEHPEPGLFRDVLPAWSDPNLSSLVHHVRSGLFLAHVRASTGSASSRNNCHPFVCGRWCFMHNGQVGGFDGFRQRVEMMIDEKLYCWRKGATDSEALFLVAMSEGLENDPKGAMARAIGRLEALSRDRGVEPHMRATLSFSDGQTIYAVRYASDDHAPSLYHRLAFGGTGRIVTSEPLDIEDPKWSPIPSGSFLKASRDGIEFEEFAPTCPSSDPIVRMRA